MRRDNAFATVDPGGRFLEIGPSHHPALPRREGFDTVIVDHLDRDGLVEKYRHFEQYDTDLIEDVDHVLVDGRGLAETVSERFDLVLAAHVLEHTTSLVHFLEECRALLAPGGTVALVVPDSRYCFDRFRERSSLARVVDAWFEPPAVHTPGTMADFHLRAVKHRGAGSWVEHHRGRYAFVHDPEAARAAVERARTSSDYADVHNWVFTPHHLRLLVEELHELGLTSLRESHFQDTVGHEFYLNLTPDGPGPGLSRQELLTLADDERRVDRPVWAPEGRPPA